jgi:16S rRNA (adenine1518-N6/adenine1519-N6)-dimethyltransferase
MTTRFTKSELVEQFQRVGFRPNPLRGQCFLVDLNMLDAVVAAASLKPTDFVLEIGCGPGNLTAELASQAGRVLAVEVEPLLYRLAKENLEFASNVRLILADAMESKYKLNPLLVKEILRALRGKGVKQFKVVSNLPYGISVPVIMSLIYPLSLIPHPSSLIANPSSLILAVQKEVADRLTAPPGVKDYGPVTVAAQSVARIRRLRKMPRDVFWPRPEVESTLIEIVPDDVLRARIADPEMLHRLTSALFEQRRKTLMNCLRGSKEFAEDWPRVHAALAKCEIPPSLRGEALSVEQIIALANVMAKSR